jgi:hypothetical protein
MSQTGGGTTKGQKPQAAKDAPKSTMKDTKGNGGCHAGGKPGMAQPNVKDTKGKGGCGATKAPETKAKSKSK